MEQVGVYTCVGKIYTPVLEIPSMGFSAWEEGNKKRQ